MLQIVIENSSIEKECSVEDKTNGHISILEMKYIIKMVLIKERKRNSLDNQEYCCSRKLHISLGVKKTSNAIQRKNLRTGNDDLLILYDGVFPVRTVYKVD